MTAGERAFDLKISETFFRLVTESIRLFSNKKKRLLSINDVVNDRSSSAAQIKDTYRPGSLKEHLRIIPTDGDVGLSLTILESSAEAIDGSIPDLQEVITGPLRLHR
jgi:phosphatidylserine decarboxylase